MARVNVFLRKNLLDELNREAEAEKISRSALVQNALLDYLQAKHKKRAEEEKRKKMEEASRTMDKLAKKLGDWSPQATIRKFRDTKIKDNE